VEFQWMTDSGTAAAALQAGEVDWWEQVAADLRPVLRRHRDIVMERVDFGGLMAMLRLNHLHPPFDDPAIRRALLPAINQADFMTAAMGTDRALWNDGIGVFPNSSALANDEGIGVLSGPRSFDAARSALRAAGYAGQPVVVPHPTDVVNNNALTLVAVDALRRAGLNAEGATSDWATVLQRRARQEPPGQGGWNALIVVFGGVDLGNPGQHPLLRANGRQAWFGWPTSPGAGDAAGGVARRGIPRCATGRCAADAGAGLGGRALRSARPVLRGQRLAPLHHRRAEGDGAAAQRAAGIDI
jgi:peptide/nickel transport system substrate-binding protein